MLTERVTKENATSMASEEYDPLYKNNFYLIMSSSKFYFNFRHTNNGMSFYKYLKDRGIPDDHILLLMPENHACNPRYIYQGTAYSAIDHKENLYCDELGIDYKAEDLTFDAILNLFRGRYDPNVSSLAPFLTSLALL